MSGKDLILYILQNNLEDEPVIKDGKFIGFKTINEVAVESNVGVATVYAWIINGYIESFPTHEELYIPADYKDTLRTKGVINNG